MLNRIVGGFYKTTGYDSKELFSEASLALCKALSTYEKDKGKINTYITQVVRNNLINFLKEENKYRVHESIDFCQVSRTQKHFFEFYEDLSEDVKVVVDMILDDPNKYLSMPASYMVAKVKIDLFEKDWSGSRIRKTINELKTKL